MRGFAVLKPAHELPVPWSLPFEFTSTPPPPSQELAATSTAEQDGAAAARGAVPTSTAIQTMAMAIIENMEVLHRCESGAATGLPATFRHVSPTMFRLPADSGLPTCYPACRTSQPSESA